MTFYGNICQYSFSQTFYFKGALRSFSIFFYSLPIYSYRIIFTIHRLGMGTMTTPPLTQRPWLAWYGTI